MCPFYVKETTNGAKSLPGQCSERLIPTHTSLTSSAFQNSCFQLINTFNLIPKPLSLGTPTKESQGQRIWQARAWAHPCLSIGQGAMHEGLSYSESPVSLGPFKLKNHIGVSYLVLRSDFFLTQSEKIGLADSVFFEKLWTMTVSIKSPHLALTFGEVLSTCLMILEFSIFWHCQCTSADVLKVDSSEKQMESRKCESVSIFPSIVLATLRVARSLLHVMHELFGFYTDRILFVCAQVYEVEDVEQLGELISEVNLWIIYSQFPNSILNLL